MIQSGWNSALLWATGLSVLYTILLKVGPITILRGDSLPLMLRKWLDFVPVAVMAALVGPDVFIYDGHFDISTSNLFLLVSIPTLAVAIISRNYFITIAVGIALVIVARYFGLR